MLSLRINKSPIAWIDIPDSLEYINIRLNPSNIDEKEFIKTHGKILDTIHLANKPETGFLSYSRKEITLLDLKDINVKLAELDITFRACIPDSMYLLFQKQGMCHTIQNPIMQLLKNGFINETQSLVLNNYILERVSALRPTLLPQLDQLSNEYIFTQVHVIFRDSGWLLLLNPPREVITKTFEALELILLNKGDLVHVGEKLNYLLATEKGIDDLIKTLPNGKYDNMLKDMLIKLQSDVKIFVARHKTELDHAVEYSLANQLQKVARSMYSMWRLQPVEVASRSDEKEKEKRFILK